MVAVQKGREWNISDVEGVGGHGGQADGMFHWNGFPTLEDPVWDGRRTMQPKVGRCLAMG